MRVLNIFFLIWKKEISPGYCALVACTVSYLFNVISPLLPSSSWGGTVPTSLTPLIASGGHVPQLS